MKRLLLALVLLAAGCGGGGGSSPTPKPPAKTTAFCINVAAGSPVLASDIRAARFDCVRQDFLGQTGFMASVIAAGMKAVLITPHPQASDLADPSAYIATVTAGEKAYPGQSWELVNEPDQGTDTPGAPYAMTPAQYVAFAKVVVPAMRAADPTATMISGGAVGKGGVDPNWISEISGAWALFDEIGLHPYPPPWLDNPIPTLPAILASVTAMTGRTAVVTEWGLAQQYAPLKPGDPLSDPLTQAQAAADMTQMIPIIVSTGTPLFVIYEWDNADDPWAATEGFGIVGTPELAAFTSALIH